MGSAIYRADGSLTNEKSVQINDLPNAVCYPLGEDGSYTNSVLLDDGRVLVVWHAGDNIRQGYAQSKEGLFFDDSITNKSTIFSGTEICASLSKLDAGLFLTIAYQQINSDYHMKSLLYKSENGDGSDWAVYATLADCDWSSVAGINWYNYGNLTQIKKIGDKYVLATPVGFISSKDILESEVHIKVSTDLINWTTKLIDDSSYAMGYTVSSNFLEVRGKLYWFFHNGYASGRASLYETSDGFESYTEVFRINLIDYIGELGSRNALVCSEKDGRFFILSGGDDLTMFGTSITNLSNIRSYTVLKSLSAPDGSGVAICDLVDCVGVWVGSNLLKWPTNPERFIRIRNQRHFGNDGFAPERVLSFPLEPDGTLARCSYMQNTSTGSNIIQLSNGTFMCAYRVDHYIWLATCPDERFFDTPNCFSNDFTTGIYIGHVSHNQTSLFRRSDGKLLLFVIDSGEDFITNSTFRVYKSDNGLGTDLVLQATPISIAARDRMSAPYLNMGVPLKLPSGRLVLTFPLSYAYNGSYTSECVYGVYSDDDGDSWGVASWYDWEGKYMGDHYGSPITAIQGCSTATTDRDGNLYCEAFTGSAKAVLCRSVNDGASWQTLFDWSEGFSDNPPSDQWCAVLYYDPLTDMAYKYSPGSGILFTLTKPTASRFTDKTAWHRAGRTSYANTPSAGHIYPMPSGRLAIMAANRDEMGTYILGLEPPAPSFKRIRGEYVKPSTELAGVRSWATTPVDYIEQGKPGIEAIKISNWIPCASKYIAAYMDPATGHVCIMSCDDTSFLTTDLVGSYVLDTGIQPRNYQPDSVILFKRPSDGKLLMFVADFGSPSGEDNLPATVKAYISEDIFPPSFSLYSTVTSVAPQLNELGQNIVGMPFVTTTGRIILPVTQIAYYANNYNYGFDQIFTSDDAGLTWTKRFAVAQITGLGLTTGQPAQLPDGTIVIDVSLNGSAREWVYYSVNDGTSWARLTELGFYNGFTPALPGNFMSSSFFYDPKLNRLYRVSIDYVMYIDRPSLANIANKDLWIRDTSWSSLGYNFSNTPRLYTLPDGTLVVQCYDNLASHNYSAGMRLTATWKRVNA